MDQYLILQLRPEGHYEFIGTCDEEAFQRAIDDSPIIRVISGKFRHPSVLVNAEVDATWFEYNGRKVIVYVPNIWYTRA